MAANKIPVFRPSWMPTKKERDRQYSADRRRRDREFVRFYSRKPWLKLRADYVVAHPCCEICEANGLTVLTDEVHHKVDRRDDRSLELSWENLIALCTPCHSRITQANTNRRRASEQ